MKRFAAIFFVLAIIFAPSCKFLRDRGIIGKKAKTLTSLLAQQDSIRVADSIRNVQEQLVAIENAKLDSIKLAADAAIANNRNSRYNIIVGSFLTPEYAKGLAEAYNQQGYDTKVLKMEGSNFELVSAESHDDIRRAIKRLKAFQDTVEIDAWIFIKE